MCNKDSLQRMSSDTDMRLLFQLMVAWLVLSRWSRQEKDKGHTWTGATDDGDAVLRQTDGSSRQHDGRLSKNPAEEYLF